MAFDSETLLKHAPQYARLEGKYIFDVQLHGCKGCDWKPAPPYQERQDRDQRWQQFVEHLACL